jgi:hypothetical protein
MTSTPPPIPSIELSTPIISPIARSNAICVGCRVGMAGMVAKSGAVAQDARGRGTYGHPTHRKSLSLPALRESWVRFTTSATFVEIAASRRVGFVSPAAKPTQLGSFCTIARPFDGAAVGFVLNDSFFALAR